MSPVLLQAESPHKPIVSPTAPRPRARRSRAPGAHRKPAVRPVVIGPALFVDALVRERRRVYRFDQPLVLLLVSVADAADADRRTALARVIEALGAAKRAADVLGWFEKDAVLGVIMPEIAGTAEVISRSVEARVRKELMKRLDAATLALIEVRLHVHAVQPGAEESDLEALDALMGAHPSLDGIRLRAFLKRGVDIFGSLALLVGLSPVFAAVAALVKLKSPGPVFFRQARVGRLGKSFTMFKFRTMTVNADHGVHQEFVSWYIKSSGEHKALAPGAAFKLTNDTRVTRIGSVLRKTSLDELPQLWNVLRGDMSLVGPRPALQFEVDQYRPWHRRRVLEAKPGITGLWQVKGRSRTTFDDMVRLDLRYVRQCSLWTDIKILVATPAAVISGKGAR